MVPAAWGQAPAEREHFQLRIGASYDQGDFGSSETSKVLYTPVTLRYLGERFDAGVTASFARVNTAGGLRLLEGEPTPTGEQTGSFRDTSSGAGDTVLRGRFYLVESSSTAVSPFVKIKIPTAREELNLGTGKTDFGGGVEVDQQLGSNLLFGDISYTVIGKLPGLDLRNRVGFSVGAGRRLSDSFVVSGLLDWRRALVRGNADPAELVGVLTWGFSRTVSISPNVFVGLSTSSPDFGGGIELTYRFGRY
jgi:hypothetical protein